MKILDIHGDQTDRVDDRNTFNKSQMDTNNHQPVSMCGSTSELSV